jgi:hypothetical protein
VVTTRVIQRNPAGPGLQEVDVTSGGAVTTADVGVPGQLGSSPYTTLKDFLQNTRSAGRISGGTISSHGDGTVDITQMDGMIFTIDSIAGIYIPFRKAASNITGITDLSDNWLYINYDSGNLTYHATTDRSTIHEFDQFVIGRVYRKGTTIEVMQSGHNIYNKDRRAHDRLVLKYGSMDYVSGAKISQPTALHLSVTLGNWYIANYPYTTPAFDSSGASRFTSYYQSGASAWTSATGLASIGTTQYNKTSSGAGQYTLQNISNNNWGVHWVYLDPTGDVYVIYGQGDYAKLSDAQAAEEPAYRPPELVNWGRLIGKLTFSQGNSSFDYVESVFNLVLSQSAATVHNQLAGLQGGTTNEYYHLTSAAYTIIGTFTTVGQNLIKLATPAVISYPQVQADGTVVNVSKVRTFDTTDASASDAALVSDGGLLVKKKAIVQDDLTAPAIGAIGSGVASGTITSQLVWTSDGIGLSFHLSGPNGWITSPSITTLYQAGDWRDNRLIYATARTNLCWPSEDPTGWSGSNASAAASAVIGPDGVSLMFAIKDTVSNTSHYIYTSSIAYTSGVVCTMSGFAKMGTKQYLRVAGSSLIYPAAARAACFDLSSGIVDIADSGISVSISRKASWPTGVYRWVVTATPNASASNYPMALGIGAHGSTALATYVGDGTSECLYVWGMQCEFSSVVTGYIKTTSAPLTLTDYTVDANGKVTLAVLPAASCTFTFTGSGTLIPLSATRARFGSNTGISEMKDDGTVISVSFHGFPIMRKLFANQTTDDYASLVIQGPLLLNGYTLTMGTGALIRIYT